MIEKPPKRRATSPSRRAEYMKRKRSHSPEASSAARGGKAATARAQAATTPDMQVTSSRDAEVTRDHQQGGAPALAAGKTNGRSVGSKPSAPSTKRSTRGGSVTVEDVDEEDVIEVASTSSEDEGSGSDREDGSGDGPAEETAEDELSQLSFFLKPPEH